MGKVTSSIALDSGSETWTFAQVDELSAELAKQFKVMGSRVLASLLDNSPGWVIVDIAARRAGLVHVPLPPFFTPSQISHAISTAGVDTVLTDSTGAALWSSAPSGTCNVANQRLVMLQLDTAPAAMPLETAKITFTSRTTGSPKGVCLSANAMDRVADGLAYVLAPLQIERHLCALPFPVLLENIAGLMAPMRTGAACLTPPMSVLGLTGSSGFDVAQFNATVHSFKPHSLILLPQMLRAWIAYLLKTSTKAPDCLKFVAVGGAAVGANLIHTARSLGIPAYEGYGLSEGASVQTLNVPGRDRPGSAGFVLPHSNLRIAKDGEIEVSGSLFAGYLGDTKPLDVWWPTGDIGCLDAEGFLHVNGRKKNVLITGFGRNVSPEWVETELTNKPGVLQAVVFGDGQPALSAVLWPMSRDMSDEQLSSVVDAANRNLPDYAHVQHWCRAELPFTSQAGMATANGRPRREEVLRHHLNSLHMTQG